MTYFEFNEKFPTDKSILQHFRTIRYKNGLTCPHCGSTQQVGLRTDQPKLCNCNHCHNTFSIFTGTIFEKSSTDLKKWFFAVHLVLNAKKGISALQLQREIGTTYKTAWRMLKQIRTAMGNENLEKSFELIVEVDETYVGGKPRKQNNNLQFTTPKPKDTSTTGRGTKKMPVIGVKERETGRVYARVALPNEEGERYASLKAGIFLGIVACTFPASSSVPACKASSASFDMPLSTGVNFRRSNGT